MRYFPLNALIVLLVAAVLVAPLAPLPAQGWSALKGVTDPPAGCHENGPMVPAPAPSNHGCCQSGHHTAFLQISSPAGPSLEALALIELPQAALASASVHSLQGLAIISGDPPIHSPLRV